MQKTPDEIKKGLECCKKSFCSFACMKICPYFKENSCGVLLYQDALALIQQLESDVDNLLVMVESGEKVNSKRVAEGLKELFDNTPRWISVEERLPENYISVIGYLPIDDKEGLPPTREVYRTEKGWFAPSLGGLCIVTHWMSMPEGFREV